MHIEVSLKCSSGNLGSLDPQVSRGAPWGSLRWCPGLQSLQGTSPNLRDLTHHCDLISYHLSPYSLCSGLALASLMLCQHMAALMPPPSQAEGVFTLFSQLPPSPLPNVCSNITSQWGLCLRPGHTVCYYNSASLSPYFPYFIHSFPFITSIPLSLISIQKQMSDPNS